MSYRTYSKNGAPDVLAATHVTSSGAMTPYTIAGSGGTPGHWWLLERAGQSVLVWTEINGSGPDLYIGPLCN